MRGVRDKVAYSIRSLVYVLIPDETPSAEDPTVVEREAIELGKLAVEIAFIASGPTTRRVARQQRNTADPQPACVAINSSGAEPEMAREG